MGHCCVQSPRCKFFWWNFVMVRNTYGSCCQWTVVEISTTPILYLVFCFLTWSQQCANRWVFASISPKAHVVVVRRVSCVRLFATPWTAARQASLSVTSSRSPLKLTLMESAMPSHPLSPLSAGPRYFWRWTPVLQTGVLRAASAPWGMTEQARPLRDHREPGNLLNCQVGKYIVPLEMEISHRKMQWVFSLVLCRMNKYNCRINVFIIQNIASQNLLTLKNS